ncbi:hypothetical protein HYFRA_00013789 [Hymenoscyphus fraxineus]|uniref:Uncharacterized protein n=1 Tax=Hymenoscyphus fraxineus TaxID=746836 RepID=A0A9N9PZQ7_9HELO|nr:hypothetical protein HYFRA_00013789 [Hymenoscyphus fraxineus]
MTNVQPTKTTSQLFNIALIEHIRLVLAPQPETSHGTVNLETSFKENGKMQISQYISGDYTSYWSDDSDSDDEFEEEDVPDKDSPFFHSSQLTKKLKEFRGHLSKILNFDTVKFPLALQTFFANLDEEGRGRAVRLAHLLAEDAESIIWLPEKEVETKLNEREQAELLDLPATCFGIIGSASTE